MAPRFLTKGVVSGAILLRGAGVWAGRGGRGIRSENLDVFSVSSRRGSRGHASAQGGGPG